MSDQKLHEMLKDAKRRCIEIYRKQSFGDLSNNKNAKYINKMKTEFEARKKII